MKYVYVFLVVIFSILDAYQVSVMLAGKADIWTYIWIVSNTFLLSIFLAEFIKSFPKEK